MVEALQQTELDFCFSCGKLQRNASNPCAECGDKFAAPVVQTSNIGNVVSFWWKFRRRVGVIIEENENESTLLVGVDQTISCPTDKVRKAKIVVDMREEASLAYRFEDLMLNHDELAEALGPWINRNLGALLATKDAARLYASSALKAGQPSLAQKSGLSVSELQWLQMHGFANSGEWYDALKTAVEIQPDRYPDRLEIIVRALVMKGVDDLEPGIVAGIRSIPDFLPGAALAKALVAELPVARIVDALSEVDALLSLPMEPRLVAWLTWLSGDHGQSGPDFPDTLNLHEHTVTALASTSDHTFTWGELLTLYREFPSIADDLVDAGTISMSDELWLKGSQALGDEGVYLLARVRPEGLDDGQLLGLEHSWEIGRRAYLQRDDGALQKMGHASAAEHYQALASLRRRKISDQHRFQRNTELLNEIGACIQNATLSPTVLADPTVCDALHTLIDDPTVLQGFPHASRWHLKNVMAQVFEWNWDGAAESARQVLRDSRDEVVRDEALNVLAFVHYMTGADDQAVQALGKALEDDYSANLQANMGVVAEHLDPESAAEHLGNLAYDAPSPELRLAAARRAYGIWSSRPVWQSDDEDTQFPTRLRDVFRQLAVEDTPLDDHRETMRLLAFMDSDWVADETHTQRSRHVSTREHKFYVARAKGDPTEYVSLLAKFLKSSPDTKWLQDERDSFVGQIRELVFESIEDQEAIGPALFAWTAIREGLPMEPLDQVVLTCGAVYSMVKKVQSEGDVPSDKMLEQLQKAEALQSNELEPDQQEKTRPFIDGTFDAYAQAQGNGVIAAYNEVVEASNMMRMRLSEMGRVKWSVVREEWARPIRRHILELAREMDGAKAIARDQKVKDWLGETADDIRGLEESIRIMSRDNR